MSEPDEPATAHVTVTASGAFARQLPAGSPGAAASVAIPEGGTVADLLGVLNLSPERPALIIVNGMVVTLEARAEHALNDGDTLAIAPPIRAG